MKKHLTKEQKTINYITSILVEMINESKHDCIHDEIILSGLASILQELDKSELAVKILEQEEFGSTGKYEATAIKVNEGW